MSDRWISISLETLYEASIAALVDACSERAKADGQDDRAPGIIAGVIAEVRRKIASCKTNTLDSDETKIPASLRDLTVDLILFRLKKALGIALEEDERKALERHERNLDRIAACTDVIDQPDDEATPETQSASGTPSATECRAQTRRRRRSG